MNRGGIIMGLLFKVVIIVVLMAAGLYFSLDYIAEFGLEVWGTWAAGTRVSVSLVDIDFFKGKGTVNGVEVSAPTGFSDEKALRVKSVDFKLDLQAFRATPLVVDHVVVDGPEVMYTRNGSGTSNIETILNNIDQFLNKRLEQGQTEAKKLNVRIRRFTVKNGSLAVKPGNLPGKLQVVRLPSVTLTNVGGRDGSAPARLGKIIASTFGRAILKTASGRGLESYLEIVLTDKVWNKAKDFVKKVF